MVQVLFEFILNLIGEMGLLQLIEKGASMYSNP